MAILLNDNLTVQEAGLHLDSKYGPYGSMVTALTSVPITVRARGLTVGIIENNSLKEYWFKDGINNINLTEKNISTSSGSTNEIKTDFTDNTTYTGIAIIGTLETLNSWTIKKTVYTTLGAVLSTVTTSNVSWINRLTL